MPWRPLLLVGVLACRDGTRVDHPVANQQSPAARATALASLTATSIAGDYPGTRYRIPEPWVIEWPDYDRVWPARVATQLHESWSATHHDYEARFETDFASLAKLDGALESLAAPKITVEIERGMETYYAHVDRGSLAIKAVAQRVPAVD